MCAGGENASLLEGSREGPKRQPDRGAQAPSRPGSSKLWVLDGRHALVPAMRLILHFLCHSLTEQAAAHRSCARLLLHVWVLQAPAATSRPLQPSARLCALPGQSKGTGMAHASPAATRSTPASTAWGGTSSF